MSNNGKRYRCPYCSSFIGERDKLIKHIDKSHEDMIPDNYTPSQLVFNIINKKTCGRCVVCKKETSWNETTGKYNRLCDNPACKEKLRSIYKNNMIKVYGKTTLLDDPEHQKKMLSNRSISGKYKFSDGGYITYTGSYEKKALEFMDKVLNIPSKDIMAPGPQFEYEYNGEKHVWITDIYYIPANLVIEVKDGGSNPNNRTMTSYREKQVAKETMLTDRGEFNYLRLTDNNFLQLIDILAELKENAMNGEEDRILSRIHEQKEILNNYITEGKLFGVMINKNKLKDPNYVKSIIKKIEETDNIYYNIRELLTVCAILITCISALNIITIPIAILSLVIAKKLNSICTKDNEIKQICSLLDNTIISVKHTIVNKNYKSQHEKEELEKVYNQLVEIRKKYNNNENKNNIEKIDYGRRKENKGYSSYTTTGSYIIQSSPYVAFASRYAIVIANKNQKQQSIKCKEELKECDTINKKQFNGYLEYLEDLYKYNKQDILKYINNKKYQSKTDKDGDYEDRCYAILIGNNKNYVILLDNNSHQIIYCIEDKCCYDLNIKYIDSEKAVKLSFDKLYNASKDSYMNLKKLANNKVISESYVNEYMSVAAVGGLPSLNKDIYVAAYSQNNIFTGHDDYEGLCISKGLFDNDILGIKDGVLDNITLDENSNITIFKFKGDRRNYLKLLESYKKEMSDFDIYSILSGKEMFSKDQIFFDELFEKV